MAKKAMETWETHGDAGRIYAGKSAEQRQAQQRQRYLEAGLELFGTIGFRATTVRLLRKQSGLIDRYFYRNFSTTEDLLEAVYNASMDRIEARVMEAVVAKSSAADISVVINASLDAFFAAIEDRRIARVCWLEVLGVSPRIDSVYVERTQRFARLLSNLAVQIVSDRLPRNEESEIVSIAAIGAISQAALHWLLSDYKAPRRTVVSATSKVLRGLTLVMDEPPAKNSKKSGASSKTRKS